MADIREKEQQQNTDFEKNYIDENIKADQDSKAKAFIKKFMKRKTAVLGLIVIVVLVIIAIIGPYITPYDYTAYDYMNTLAGPSPEHLFGTDQYGRDILSRMLVGTRLTLGVSLSAVVIGAALGTVLGLLAGYYGGVIEMLVMRGSDVLFSFPDILLAIAILDALAEVTGMDKKNDWFRFLLLATVALSGTTEVFFPFKPYAALYMSIFDAQLNTIGAACDGNTWLITAAIMAVLSFVILMLLARFAFKFDLRRMKELDVSVLQTPEFKKMSKKQVIVLISVILTFFYPFILMLLPKESGVYLFLNNIGQNLFMGFVICLLCLIHVDGEPIAEIGDVFKNGTNWQIIFAVGSVIAIGGAMAADVCGVATWLLSIFQGVFGGMSIVTVVIIVCLLSCIITQFFSNSATAILFLTALAPLAVALYQEGVNVSVFPALIGTGTLTACLLPSGSGQSAIMLSTDIFADDGQQWALSKGVIVLVGITLAIVAAGIISILIL